MKRLAEIVALRSAERVAARYTAATFRRDVEGPVKLRCLADGCAVRVEAGGSGYCRKHWRLASGRRGRGNA